MKPENPLVFPQTEYSTNWINQGMTLRDYLAGQALPQCQAINGRRGIEEVASIAYSFADAMLKVREEI